MARQVSEAGLAHIMVSEGVRLKAYPDPGSRNGHPWTIGYGHTSLAGPPKVTPGMTITRDEARRILRRDLRKSENYVERAVSAPLTQGQFDALVSFVFNVGPGQFNRSTLLRKLNAGDYKGASREFGKWVNNDGRRMTGLVRRRKAEQKLFNSTSRTYKGAGMGVMGSVMQGGLVAGGSYQIMDMAQQIAPEFTWGKYLLLGAMAFGAAISIFGIIRVITAKANDRRRAALVHGDLELEEEDDPLVTNSVGID